MWLNSASDISRKDRIVERNNEADNDSFQRIALAKKTVHEGTH